MFYNDRECQGSPRCHGEQKREYCMIIYLLIFNNSFIEIQFTHLITHLFKVYNSMILIYSHICAIITTIIFRTFSSPQKTNKQTSEQRNKQTFILFGYHTHRFPYLVSLPAQTNCESAFCLYIFPCSGYFISIQSYNMWSFMTAFFHLA